MKELELFYNNLRTRKTDPTVTIKNYDLQIKEFLKILNIISVEDFSGVTAQDVDKYKLELVNSGNKLSTIRTKMSAIKSFGEFLVDRGYINRNIINNRMYPTPQKTKKNLPETNYFKEIIKLSKYNKKYFVITNLFISTGMRFSEVANLKIKDLQDGYIRIVGKGSKERIVILQDNIYSLLKDYIEKYRENIPVLTKEEFDEKIRQNVLRYKNMKTYDNYLAKRNEYKDLIFQSQSGFIMSNANFDGHLKKIAKKAGINIEEKDMSAHILRHFNATFSLENGVPLDVVQENLGHANINTTRIYAETSLQRRKEENKKACWQF